MQLPEHAVEQVPQGLHVPVPASPSAPVVGVGASRAAEGSEGPEVADVVEPVVLDEPTSDVVPFARGSGDRGRARVCLQPSGAVANRVRSSPISARIRAPIWEPMPGKLSMIEASGMGSEGFLCGLSKVGDRFAGGVQLQQGRGLLAHRFFNQRDLVRGLAAEELLQ